MSDIIKIDLTNYKDRVGQRVTPGRYRVQVEDADADTASTGNAMITLWLVVADGEFKGATIIDRLTQTEKALFRTVGFMQAIGLPTPKKSMQINIRSWVGKYLDVDVDDGEPYMGRVKSEVRGYNRILGSKGAGAEPADLPTDLSGLSEFSGNGGTPDAVANAEELAAPDEVDLDKLDL